MKLYKKAVLEERVFKEDMSKDMERGECRVYLERKHLFVNEAIIKFYRWGGLSNGNLFRKNRIKLLAGLVFSEASLLGLQMAASLCSHMFFPLCCVLSVSLCGQLSSFYKNIHQIGLRSTLKTSF